ncbi:SLC13 family permease [Desulfatitalea tepidiphila]|uniref:SLC13 family permease n=1 Tax=Desulfatitalea tepidiphila TaxID=1185843 RepID=UPI0006B5A7AF|nr:SLC13 family permease [Desulfatitalea tepidiphila]
MEIAIVTIILAVTLYLLISERIPIDLTAIGIMTALTLSGILSPQEAVAGFANPAVITVGAMFLISQAMIRTGVVGFIGQKVMTLARGRAVLALLVVLLIVAVASAFINNTPVVVLFIPVIISMGCRLGFSPSKYLIPISYISILAGTCTLIGTSTNIIVSDLSSQYGFGSLSMFELGKVGLPLAIAGLVLILIAAPRLMPDLNNPTCELENEPKRRYLAELTVPRGSGLIHMDPCLELPNKYPGIEVLQLIRYSHIFHPCRDTVTIAPDDLLLVKGSPNDLNHILQGKDVELPPSEKGLAFNGQDDMLVMELIIPPQSDLLGQRLGETHLARDEDLHIVAVERSGLHYTEHKIKDIRLKIGDILLVWCSVSRVDKFRGRSDWIMVEDVHHEIVHSRKAPLAAGIFAAMVVAAATGLANIMVCALAAVFFMVLTGALSLKEAYRALQSNVLMLIAGTIALGTAMDQTGTSRYYAQLFLSALEGWSPHLVLGGFILLTSISTQVLSNNATAVLLLPVAISTAVGLQVDPKPFIMAVCFGASACFATPIGYQTNLLVYGPGGYRFSDYLKLGIPLNLLVIVGGTILVPIFWPF